MARDKTQKSSCWLKPHGEEKKKKPKAGTEKKLKLWKEKKGKSPNQSQKLQQETNHMEKRKKRNQKPEQRRNKAAEEKKEKKERDFNVNVSVTWLLKSELFHLMSEASCPNFIGGAWSGA